MKLIHIRYSYFAIILLFVLACSNPKKEFATMLIYGGTIYTVDATSTTVEAVAIKNNTIVFAGTFSEAENLKITKQSL